jgi:DNA-directed RNA polymerase specialized sigma24 family protein
MIKKSASTTDPLLTPLLQTVSDDQANDLFAQLIAAHANSVIDGVIRYKLRCSLHHLPGPTDTDDLHQESVMQLLSVLRQFHRQPETHPINDLRGLAAVIAHRACSRWMRRQFPERHALKNRLYYLLTHQNGFAVWQNQEKKLMAGFSIWQGKKKRVAEERIRHLPENERLVVQLRRIAIHTTGRQEERKQSSSPSGVGAALAATFNYLEGPIEFDRLVGAVADLLSLKEQSMESADDNERAMELIVSGTPDPAWQAEKRIFLQKLWDEVLHLPLHQRAALLLNLRGAEGAGCIALFPATGVASFRQLAASLEMSGEELAELWNELPLEDSRIAELLRLTRQQVINARKSARERLTRHLKGYL